MIPNKKQAPNKAFEGIFTNLYLSTENRLADWVINAIHPGCLMPFSRLRNAIHPQVICSVLTIE